MTILSYAAFVVFLMFLYKILSNSLAWYKLHNFKKIYEKYIYHSNQESEKWKKLNSNVLESKNEIINLLKIVGIEDFSIQIMFPAGFDHVVPRSLSVLKNLEAIQEIGNINIPSTVYAYLIQAMGIYKKRIFEAFNPLFWIDLIIFLPSNIINYLGLSQDNKEYKTIRKTIEVFYWIAVTARFHK